MKEVHVRLNCETRELIADLSAIQNEVNKFAAHREQDEALMRQALEALDEYIYACTPKADKLGIAAVSALRMRLK
ncbi:MAG TPA: hypothetical protein VIC30_11685 [Orrella sp.]